MTPFSFQEGILFLYTIIISGLIGVIAFAGSGKTEALNSLPDKVRIGAFSQSPPSEIPPTNWESLTFPNIDRITQYRLTRHQQIVVMQARSQASASGLIRKLRFNASEHPWLSWRWKIEHVLEKGDLRVKQGDDYAARIYVAFEFEPRQASLWERIAHSVASTSAGRELPGTILTYIWANQAPQGTIADNPYSEQVKMIALQSGNARANQWIDEKRHIAEDYRRVFGREPPPAMGIAMMTDTDNTGESATAYYGDITLSRNEPAVSKAH
ncbi:MAG: DUF3047 domain-containing protein [Desulfobacteraceae bacterium]